MVLLKAGHGGVPPRFTSASAFRDLGRNGAGPGECRAALPGAADADTVDEKALDLPVSRRRTRGATVLTAASPGAEQALREMGPATSGRVLALARPPG